VRHEFRDAGRRETKETCRKRRLVKKVGGRRKTIKGVNGEFNPMAIIPWSQPVSGRKETNFPNQKFLGSERLKQSANAYKNE